MTYSLSLRPRALAEIEAARDRYALVGHGDTFLDELELVFQAILACAAADYEACAKLGCLGDRDAEQLAATHGVTATDCDRVRADAAAPSPDAVLANLTELRDRMCACKDAACAYAVAERAARQGAAVIDAKLSTEMTKKIAAATSALAAC